jgi:predicted transcriptional regulator
MKTGEYCTRQVVVIGKDETIIDAARRMREGEERE